MKKALVSLAGLVGASLLGIWLALPLVLLINWWLQHNYIDLLERVQRYDHQQAEYWFTGANRRGLVEICPDAAGEMKVLWKEDCK